MRSNTVKNYYKLENEAANGPSSWQNIWLWKQVINLCMFKEGTACKNFKHTKEIKMPPKMTS